MTGASAAAVEVVVVGGGMAGVSVAALLAVDRSVLLLEAEPQLAYHTTGRSAAVFLEGYGGPQVRALTRASRPLYEAVPDRDPDATPLLTPATRLLVADAAGVADLADMVAEVPSLQRLPPAEARRYCPALAPGYLAAAAVETDACHIDVPGLHQHYLRTGRRRGLAVRTGARVLAGQRSGGTWRLETTAGPVQAPVVVNAAGAWADRVATALGARPLGLTPLRRTVAVLPVPDVDPGWPLVDDVAETFYFRPEGSGLLISLADETPSEPIDARPEEVDVARAIENVRAATTLQLRSVSASWAGLRTFAPDRVPVAGWDPEVPGLVWLAGQGGFGIQTAPALALLAASVIRGEPIPATLQAEGVDPAALSPARLTAAPAPSDPPPGTPTVPTPT
jgi:D-arginine dehydrogenase